MSASGGFGPDGGDETVLIARVITEADGLETRLDALIEGLAASDPSARPEVGIHPLPHGASVVQVALGGADPARLRHSVETHLAPQALLIAPASEAPLRLFVSDMDSTMIGQECIDELADYAGLKPQIAAITERAMQGELDFEAALRERVGLLAGLDEGAIAQCLAERITAMPGATTLVTTLRAHGCRTVLVTGGFHHFADPVAEMLGFERVVGNRLEVAEGKLTGGLAGPIADSATKRAVLREETATLGGDIASLATGDGANDIPMLAGATYGIAYRAKPKAKDAASGWVEQGDLTAVLHLLGIAESEWTGG